MRVSPIAFDRYLWWWSEPCGTGWSSQILAVAPDTLNILWETRSPDLTIGFFLHIPFPPVELFMQLPWRKEIVKGDVIVIRYEGPKGGPGMPEMLTPTSAVMGAGLGKDVALITDGRFSGGSHGFIVGHITPEAQEGGPIALIRSGDRITIDAEKNLLSVDLSEDELAARRRAWKMPPYKSDRGTLAKYIRLVKSASLGCVTDE